MRVWQDCDAQYYKVVKLNKETTQRHTHIFHSNIRVASITSKKQCTDLYVPLLPLTISAILMLTRLIFSSVVKMRGRNVLPVPAWCMCDCKKQLHNTAKRVHNSNSNSNRVTNLVDSDWQQHLAFKHIWIVAHVTYEHACRRNNV